MRLLFLYTELAEYTISCLKALKKTAPDIEILVIHFPVNPEAPFRFEFGDIGRFECIDRFRDYALFKQNVLQFKPERIVCGGWISKWYLRICIEYRNKGLCILTLDNHWHGTFKQQLLRLVSGSTLKKIFHKVWVPGAPQIEYAKKLGFKEQDIKAGFYCCDIDHYNAFYEKFREAKKQQFPHRFLCVARYVPAKGYQDLWKAFIEWKEHSVNDWELWCAGTGEQFDERVEHPTIRHLGFVQKDDWHDIIRQTGVFVLPSIFEPWGVVVHEFAASGYPLMLSNRVGAADMFVTERNGMCFTPSYAHELIQQFQTISTLEEERLYEMATISHQLAQQLTPAKWANILLGF